MRDRALPTAVPDQLARIREDQADGLVVDGVLQALYELDCGAVVDGFLADEAVGEDAEVLHGFADEEDDAFGGAEGGGGEDGDVREAGGGGEGEAEGGEAGGGEAGEDDVADAC